MKTSWIVLLGLGMAALAPAGMKSATWLRQRCKPVDPALARAGEVLFKHVWTPGDPLAGGGDGVGPVFNANSCVACHFQSGPGGSGDEMRNVTTYTIRPMREGAKPREGVVHAESIWAEGETLAHVDPALPPISSPGLETLIPIPGRAPPGGLIRFPPGVQVAQLNTPALFGDKLIDEIPDRVIIANERRQRLKWGLAPADADGAPVGRASRLTNGRIGKFGWKAQTASLSAFVQAACANELGLGNPSQAQPRPMNRPDYQPPGLDLTAEQCDQLTAFVAALPRPVELIPEVDGASVQATAGKKVFHAMGCADCHTPDLGSVPGLYSDLLLHPMSREMQAGGAYYEIVVPIPDLVVEGPSPREWRTPPLWGVADSAPYLHDGRAATLEEAIRLHGGQGLRSSQRFQRASAAEQDQLIAFLKTLRAPRTEVAKK
jgi:CxxC motif-containing protein (DUF1111 family)